MARILLADDEPDVLDALRGILEDAGHEVLTAVDGDNALKILRRQFVDLVVTDVIMPAREGLELIMILKRDNPGIGVVAISGGGALSKEATLTIADRLGADCTLAKPFTREEFLRSVTEVLNSLSPSSDI